MTDPTMPSSVQFRPVSPKLALVRMIGVGLGTLPFVILFAALALLGRENVLWLFAAGFATLFLWGLWIIPRQVRAIGYAMEPADFLVRKGIMFRKLVAVPYGRIQYVDVKEGPVSRKFGIASVQLHTASAQTDASLDGLPAPEAAHLRDVLVASGATELSGL